MARKINHSVASVTEEVGVIADTDCETPKPESVDEIIPDEQEKKTLDVTNLTDLRKKVSDVKTFGNPDTFTLLCKASSDTEGWLKSTKVCNVPGGCIVQVSTQQRNPDGSYAVAEALTYVPGTHIDTREHPPKMGRHTA